MKTRVEAIVLPLMVASGFVLTWHFAVKWSGSDIFPTPPQVVAGMLELLRNGLLFKYIVASLFRVSAGFLLALVVGIPFGLLLGWFGRAFHAFNPAIQVLRPISPIAWIPVAILWFGVSDLAPIFLIFLASLFPIATATIAAVQNIHLVYLRVAKNLCVKGLPLFRQIVFPAAIPQIITGISIELRVACMVEVAPEI